MNLSSRSELIFSSITLILALLIGVIIYASLAPIGIGVSTDGVNYIFTAYNLSQGLGYISYDNTPLTWWPPLYPTLLAGIHLITGADFLAITFWFNVATFVGLVFSTFILARQIFRDRMWFVFWSTLTAAGGYVLVASAQNAGTDYLAAFLVVVALIFCGEYVRKPSASLRIWLAVVGMLSVMQRYIGITVIALAMLVIFFYTPGSFMRKVGLASAQAVALIPLAAWGYRNILTGTGPFGPRVPYHNSLSTNIRLSFRVISQWIMPDTFLIDHALWKKAAWLVVLLIFLTIVITSIWAIKRYQQVDSLRDAVPVIVYAFLFPAALILNASVTYFKDICDRFLVPVYIPMLLTFYLGLETVVRFIKTYFPRILIIPATAVPLIVIPLLFNLNNIAQTNHLIEISKTEGVEPDNLYENPYWQDNQAVEWVTERVQQDHEAMLFSNRQAGVALYSWHTTMMSPKKYDQVFEEPTYSLESYISQFDQCSQQSCYLVWMLPDIYEHLYIPKELAKIVQLKEVFTSSEGIVYQITPKNYFRDDGG